jgi:hypothetical protein
VRASASLADKRSERVDWWMTQGRVLPAARAPNGRAHACLYMSVRGAEAAFSKRNGTWCFEFKAVSKLRFSVCDTVLLVDIRHYIVFASFQFQFQFQFISQTPVGGLTGKTLVVSYQSIVQQTDYLVVTFSTLSFNSLRPLTLILLLPYDVRHFGML